ncbi:MAG: hypothetical protein PHG02_07445, partial [Oscillospiraceae bacterium]|nr:hypothetical protein [Oscillospiraceae bacterium]
KKISRLRIASVIAKYKKGTHIMDGKIIPEMRDCISFTRGREVEIVSANDFIANIDGECGPRKKFHAVLKDKAASLILPKVLAQHYLKGIAHPQEVLQPLMV